MFVIFSDAQEFREGFYPAIMQNFIVCVSFLVSLIFSPTLTNWLLVCWLFLCHLSVWEDTVNNSQHFVCVDRAFSETTETCTSSTSYLTWSAW